MRAIHDRLTALEQRIAAICTAQREAEDASGTLWDMIQRLASAPGVSHTSACGPGDAGARGDRRHGGHIGE